MLAKRIFPLLIAIWLSGISWAGAYVRIVNMELNPRPEKCAAGDEIHVTGKLQCNYLLGFKSPKYISGTIVDHWLHIYIDSIDQPGQKWPQLPNLRTALGKLLVGYHEPYTDYKPSKPGPGPAVWNYHIGNARRASEKDPLTRTETRDFDFTFKVPNCVKFRLRAALDHCYGWNWFVTNYFYDWRVFPGPLAKGMKSIKITCIRRGYFPVNDIVLVPATAREAVISGIVTDRQLSAPLPGAIIKADGVSVKTGKDGSYTLRVPVGGSAPPAKAACNFSLDSAADSVNLTIKATAQGFKPSPERKIVLRVRSGTLVLCGSVQESRGGVTYPLGGAQVEAKGSCGYRRVTTSSDGWYHIEYVLSNARPGTYKKVISFVLLPIATSSSGGGNSSATGSKPDDIPSPFEKELGKRLKNGPKWGRWLLDKLAWWNAVKADIQHRMRGGSDSPNLKKYYARRKTALGEIRNAIDVITSEGIGKIPGTDKIQQAQDIYKRVTGKKPPPNATRSDIIQILRDHYNAIEEAGK